MHQISLIIVSFNIKKHLAACLQSVFSCNTGAVKEIIVVDNASTDDTASLPELKFPNVKLIQNADNIGFARACNQGLAQAKGEFVLFLNPDTILGDDALNKCLAFFSSHPDAGALSVRMVDGNGKYLKESKRGFPTLWASFWKMSGVCRIFPGSKFFSAYYMGHIDETETAEVDVLSGAFMMMPVRLAQDLGGFDERFFMYAEDIDLSRRIIEKGFKNYYLGNVYIRHLKGGSTAKKSAAYTRQFYLAMEQYVEKYNGDKPLRKAVLLTAIKLTTALAHIKRLIKNAISQQAA